MWRRLAVPGELSSTAAFTLARLSRDGPCRLTELAAHENVSQPAMTQLVSRLEGQGLAERCSEPGDARVVNVAVTAQGEELIARRRAARAARFAEVFAMLVTGWVSTRIGAKRTLVCGLALIVVFSALAGHAGGISQIVAFRAGWGLGNALFIATSLAVIVASASGRFAGAIILYETALGIGIALGPLLGGELGPSAGVGRSSASPSSCRSR
jgi:DNA-binding MarR family transcriptional regulator